MEAIPRNDGEQYRFDAFCKAVLRNEARNYHRNKKRLLDREKSFSVLSLEELGQLTSVDHYPSEESMRTMFPAKSLMNAFPECPGDMRTSKRSSPRKSNSSAPKSKSRAAAP